MAEGDGRVNLVGHSMGGLVARYYLRYGTAEPAADQPVTWAGARYIRNLILVGVPSAGSLPALEGLLYGNRVGLSYTTLAAPVIARMPSVYQLVPPAGTDALLDQTLSPVSVDLHDVETWKSFGWGPFGAKTAKRQAGFTESDLEAYPAFLEAALARARAFHAALARTPETPCPVRVALLGGDCLPTLARGVLSEKDGKGPRFEPRTRREAEAMMEPGRRPRHPHQPAGVASAGRGRPSGELRDPGGVVRVRRQRRPPRDLSRADVPEHPHADAAEAAAHAAVRGRLNPEIRVMQ